MYPTTRRNRVMTVSGTGKVKAQPDMVTIELGVMTEGRELREVQEDNARVMQQVIESIVKMGVPEESIQTVEYSVVPRYDYDNGQQVFRGYQVTNRVSITIEDIPLTGAIVDSAVQSGANQVSGITFSVKNPDMLYQQALSEALRDAYGKAVTMAQAMRLQLDPSPIKVIERGEENAVPLAKAGTFASATPIEPGELQIEAAVEVQFQFFA
ncbi:SIMPL domain-containing protein [Halobacillus sp. A5]|uniref:SIMPL domain-containing protein n=1 Tax=Halobacillus sp. A5 TaxID=2880263 RepID=UPI0020A6B48B|nr:SIMPL domain-containing protein [Halobacillus sp. A5]MCP3029416.1 SIMPL domain-containing protein [Halobacillus sp. A5]